MKISKQTVGLYAALIAIVGAIAWIEANKPAPAAQVAGKASEVALPDIAATSSAAARIASKAGKYERAKELALPSGFINTGDKPISLSDYIGKKVILLDIWTYSCVNCVRTIPYLNDWYKKYEDKGLVIIGIHTPEFEFEKDYANVKAAVEKYGIEFPVVMDNDYGTWSAYKNRYWPRKYLIDIDGFVRGDHIGEGGYEEVEAQIQGLLKERAAALGQSIDADMPLTKGLTESAYGDQSPETYFGSARNLYLANGARGVAGKAAFKIPSAVSLNKLYLGGDWILEPEYAESASATSTIVYPFTARKVFLVASADAPIPVEVVVDGKTVNTITVSTSQLYTMYEGTRYASHTLELRPKGKGFRAFAFTFGS